MIFNFPKHRSGDTFNGISSITILENGQPLILTGCDVHIEFRSAYNVASPVALYLTTKNGSITIPMPNIGVISIPEQSISMPVGLYKYDLQVDFPDGDSRTYLEGTWEIVPGTTTPTFESSINTRYNYLILTSLVTLICANSAENWTYQGYDLKALSGVWQDASTIVQQNSSKWAVESLIKSISSYWNESYNSVYLLSSSWGYQGNDLKSLSANWDLTFNTVNLNNLNWTSAYSILSSNSSVWIDKNHTIESLSSNWETAYSIINLNNLKWDSVFSTVLSNSSYWIDSWSIINSLSSNWENAYTTTKDLSANWEDIKNTVQSLSASWNYQGSDVKDLSANWEDTYTNVQANSASWSIDNSTDTQVRSLTSNWEDTYTNVQANSASWAIDSSIDTEVRSLTSNWENTYLTTNNLSSNWEDIKSTVQGLSTSWNYQGSDVKDLSGNWESTYTTYNSNSSDYVKINYIHSNYLPISGGSIFGVLSTNNTIYDLHGNSLNWNSVYSTVESNSAIWLSDTSITQESFDDFLTLGAASTLPNAHLRQCNSGGSIFVFPEDGKQGILVLSTNNLMINDQRGGVTSGNTIHFGQGTSYRLIFSAKRGVNSFTSPVSGRFDMGFHDMLDTNSLLPNDGCYFSSENGETWKTNTKTGAQPLITTDTGIPCDDTWRTFEINVNFNGTEVKFYIDNILVASHTQSIPNTNNSYTAIGYRSYRYNNNTVNVELKLDWQHLIVKRQNKLWM